MGGMTDLSEIYDAVLTRRARTDRRIFTVDAEGSWMVAKFRKEFPDRAIQVGIAEQNMIGVAAGLAAKGKIVFVNCMATFLTMRACEQIKADVMYNQFYIKLVGTFSGVLGGPYGATHHALEDMAIMRAIPGIDIVVPADPLETEKAVHAIVDSTGCTYLRLGYGRAINRNEYDFRMGQAVTLRPGNDLTLAATGSMVERSLQAADLLAARGVDARVLNIHTIKPIDREAVRSAARETSGIITVEEHSIIGGLGSAVAEVVSECCPAYVKRLGIPDTLCKIVGSSPEILEYYGLTASGIADQAVEFLQANQRRTGCRGKSHD